MKYDSERVPLRQQVRALLRIPPIPSCGHDVDVVLGPGRRRPGRRGHEPVHLFRPMPKRHRVEVLAELLLELADQHELAGEVGPVDLEELADQHEVAGELGPVLLEEPELP